MQQILKTIKPLRWLGVILFSSTILIACADSETKTTETTVTEEAVTDTLPPLDTDTANSTRPETIKN